MAKSQVACPGTIKFVQQTYPAARPSTVSVVAKIEVVRAYSSRFEEQRIDNNGPDNEQRHGQRSGAICPPTVARLTREGLASEQMHGL